MASSFPKRETVTFWWTKSGTALSSSAEVSPGRVLHFSQGPGPHAIALDGQSNYLLFDRRM